MYLVMGCVWLVALFIQIDLNCIQLKNKGLHPSCLNAHETYNEINGENTAVWFKWP